MNDFSSVAYGATHRPHFSRSRSGDIILDLPTSAHWSPSSRSITREDLLNLVSGGINALLDDYHQRHAAPAGRVALERLRDAQATLEVIARS